MCYICLSGGDKGDTAFLHEGAGSETALFLTGWDVGLATGKDDDVPQFVGDDIADNTSSTTVLAIGGSISTNLNANIDKDFFQVNLVAGQTYVFTMSRAGSAPALDTFLEIRSAGGALLKENDDGGIGTNSVLMYRATETGTHFLSAGSWNSASSGAYTVTAQAIETGPSTVTTFASNGKPQFSWTEAAYQITREGASWAPDFGQSAVVTYSFRADAPATMPSDTTGFSRFNATQIAAAEAALQAWGQVANITFVRVGSGTSGDAAYSNDASIVFANYSGGQAGASAFAYLPTSANTASSSVQGDVWINNSISTNSNPVSGEVGYHVLMHEIGHALGLSHPGDYNAEEGVSITYAANAEYQNDTRLFTVMSYFPTTAVGGAWPVYPGSPQLHDIAAIQRLYGANTSTRSGDTVYGFNSNTNRPEFTITSASQAIGFTVWDGGGNDTLDFSGFSQAAYIDLREESFMNVGPNNPTYNVVIARGAVIENAIGGSGNDTIRGNAVANTLNGGAGNDTLWGDAGDDTLWGEGGDDTLRGGDGADMLYGGAGNDRFEGDPGNDFFDGGDGYDQAAYEGSWVDDAVYRFGSVIAVLSDVTGIDRMTNIESVRWTDRIFSDLDEIPEFRALDYIAGYDDLVGALGFSGQAGFDHYLAAGFLEGRVGDGFDAFLYTASYDDLIAAWGADEDAAVEHFLLAGFSEGRARDAFDGLSYVAGYTDLLATFAGDESAAARHFIEVGYGQGRSRDAFDELRYIAGYDDLVQAIGTNRQAATFHWVYGGFGEGRSTTLFDPMQYIASYSDLILAFGANAAAGTIHFIQYGFGEGRPRDDFDAAQYLANYSDLQAAFGSDEQLATFHYIVAGYSEGRTDKAPTSSALDPVFVAVAEASKVNDLTPQVLPDLQAVELAVEASHGWDDVFGQRVRTISMDTPDPTVMAAETTLDALSATMTREPLVDWFGEKTDPAPLVLREVAQWMEAITDFTGLAGLPDAPYADLAIEALTPPDVTYDWRPTPLGDAEWSILQG